MSLYDSLKGHIPHMHNNCFAATQLEIAALCHINSIALQNISHTINAALQLDINIAVH
jgi:hypothetical protein